MKNLIVIYNDEKIVSLEKAEDFSIENVDSALSMMLSASESLVASISYAMGTTDPKEMAKSINRFWKLTLEKRDLKSCEKFAKAWCGGLSKQRGKEA